MGDFQVAFSDGLQAHENAERARAEVHGLFREFAEQVKSASGGLVEVYEGKGSRSVKSYDALLARVVGSQGKGIELCEYQIAPSGYAVTLSYEDERETCWDRGGLVAGLARLLRHPNTGGKLRQLMSQSPSPKQEG